MKEYLRLDTNLYASLYGSAVTTPNLDTFIKLPLGTILYNYAYDRLVVLRRFGNFINQNIETSAYQYVNYNYVPVKSKVSNIFSPDVFYVSSFNTASTLKLIKNGTLTEEPILNRYSYYILDEKLVSCIIPRYQSIEKIIEAANQYQTLVNNNPSLDLKIDELV